LVTTLLLLVLALALGGCGTEGNAPPLGRPGHASLAISGSGSSQASVLLTPFAALHVTVYYRGKQVPTSGALTPAQLRENGCTGPLVAPITDGSLLATGTADANGTSGTSIETSALVGYVPDPSGGMDVSVAPSANLYVVVLDHRDDPAAAIVACGDPLSGKNQYFDLFPIQTGSAGIALGTALISPIAATRLDFTIKSDSLQPAAWAVHTGSCTGSVLASGSVDSKTNPETGVIYQALDSNRWWVELTGANGQTLCGQVTV